MLLRSVCGLILLFIFNTKCIAATCGQGDGVLGNARVCFDSHVFLKTGNRMRNSDGGRLISAEIVQIDLPAFQHVKVIALLDYGQACVVKIHPEAKAVYMSGTSNLNDRFVSKILNPSLTHISDKARNDCVIEINKLGNLGYFAVIDFVEQSMIDGIIDGFIAIDRFDDANHHYEIPYLEHLKTEDFERFKWNHKAYSSRLVNQDSNIYQMGANGIVSKIGDQYYADYILDQEEYITHRVCTSSELKARYANRSVTSELKELINSTDSEIARRSIPGIWYLQLNMEASAYVFCN